MRWNVVRGGVVIGELHADEYSEAQRLALEAHGPGARVSAPADPDAPTKPQPRGSAAPSPAPRPIR